MRDIVAWVVTVELLGLAVLPLLRAFFDNRRDAALLSRPLGLALVAYVAWLLTLAQLPFERGVLIIALVAVGVAGYLVHRRTKERFPAPLWGPEEKRAALLFWAATGVFLVIRAAWPEIAGQEKFMDLAFLNSLTRNTNMPPADPWMAGRTINYYYWGYLLAAAATRLANISAMVSYNLAVATFAGYSFVAAACLGLRLSRGRLAAGIAAAVATVFAGNLAGALDGWDYFLGRGFDYFHASRVIGAGDTINEFPFFTFFQADLHPHLLAFPYFIAAFAVAHRFLVREPASTPAALPGSSGGLVRRLSPAAMLAFTGGTAIAANLWVIPAIGILMVTVCLLRKTQGQRLPPPRDAAVGALAGSILLLAAYEIWFSYESSFSLVACKPSEHGLAWSTMTSGLLEFLAVWGILLAAGIAALWPPRAPEGSSQQRRDLILALAAALCVAIGLAAGAPALIPVLFVAFLAGRIGWSALSQSHDSEEVYASFLVLLGVAMVGGCEFIHFRDSYGEKLQRMNTIFKFYNQAWPLIAVAVAVFAEKKWIQTRGARRAAFAGLLAACAAAALFYPVAAIAQRVAAHQGPVTLDARPALAARDPADAAAIAWLIKNVHGGTVVLEATGDPYTEYGRIATHTAIPTVMGWANHEGLWRPCDPEVAERVGLVRSFYTTRDPNLALQILQKFKVTHVVLGEFETRMYPGAKAIANLPFLDPVFTGPTTIFRVAIARP